MGAGHLVVASYSGALGAWAGFAQRGHVLKAQLLSLAFVERLVGLACVFGRVRARLPGGRTARFSRALWQARRLGLRSSSLPLLTCVSGADLYSARCVCVSSLARDGYR